MSHGVIHDLADIRRSGAVHDGCWVDSESNVDTSSV